MNNQEKISKLIETAKGLIGTPYKYGAYLEQKNGDESAFDCSSFIQHVFKQVEVELPRSSILQAAATGKEIKNLELAEVGDLIFFEGNRGHYRHDLFPNRKIYIGHLGIYIGNNEIIHATNNNNASGVVLQKISELQNFHPETYKIVLIKRFI